MPNPCSYSPKVHKIIVDAIRAGNFRGTAAQLAGITNRTLMYWFARGREGEQPFARLLTEVENAEAAIEDENVRQIQTAARDDWHASAWYLARKFADRWSQKSTTALTGPDGGPVQIDVTKLSDAELAAILAKGSG